MGLASALTTALTGLTAAEAKIDVVGNNLANSQTVGFKESDVTYSTQFLQTLNLGSAPSATNGGSNPVQYGLGTQVASIAANHSQGTIELSTNQTDLAIQGDGMFVVEGNSGEQLFTRTGVFSTNSNNELVTPDGNRLLGYGVNGDFELQTTSFQPLRVPLGTSAVAQATSNVTLEGQLPPIGDVAEVAGVVESQVLSDATIPQADNGSMTLGVSQAPSVASSTIASPDTGGSLLEDATYSYKFVFVDSSGTESTVSTDMTITTPIGNGTDDNRIFLDSLPTPPSNYDFMRVYRTAADGSEYFQLTDLTPAATSFNDTGAIPLSATALNDDSLSGSYNYVVTFSVAGQPETRPAPLMGPFSVSDAAIQLQDLPTPPVPGPGDTFPAYDTVNIYRTTKDDPNSFYYVGSGLPGNNFTDKALDADITDLSTPPNREANLDGPSVTSATLLTDVIVRDGLSFSNLFELGTLTMEAEKGGRSSGESSFEIEADTTVADFMSFLEQANGIIRSANGVTLPQSENLIEGESGMLTAGVSLKDGKIRIVSNNGEANEISIPQGGFKISQAFGTQPTSNALAFNSAQEAIGQGAIADFLAYDSLGIPVSVRVSTILESRDGSSTTYRWFAESPDNGPSMGYGTNVGSGTLTLDSEGNLVSVSNSTVNIDREDTPSVSPLQFDLNFDIINGLAASNASLTVASQDGAGPGTLTSFTINRDGNITGLFSNGSSRNLGQVVLAVFSNPQGLDQRGQNLYANGVNAGLSFRTPGVNGGGELIAGAVELSNTDIGRNLIDLSLASTLYRGNSRVITTSQTLLDELLNLRR